MTDEDVIERVGRILGRRVQFIRPSGAARKDQYRVAVRGSYAVELMTLLRPIMGERRQAQIDRVLAYEHARPDPNEARRAWSQAAMQGRVRESDGTFAVGSL